MEDQKRINIVEQQSDHCQSEKEAYDFFIKTRGLHGYFERNGGSLVSAIANANCSMDEKQKNGRDYTYSELGQLITALNNLSKQK